MKKMKSRLLKGFLALSMTSWLAAPGMASIVYDNTSVYTGKFHSAGNSEFGNQIYLAGTARTMNEFQFQYFATNSAGLSFTPGVEQAEVFMRFNDGPPDQFGALTPGTIFYASAPFDLQEGFHAVDITGLSVTVPDHFTWTVAFSGLLPTGDSAGLLFYSPVTIGSAFNDFWELTASGWQTMVVDGGASPATFAARLSAVPEPSTMALGLLAGLACLGLVKKKTRLA